jgi:hypothetical protein
VIEKLNGLTQHFTPAAIGLALFLVTQLGIGLVWITRQENRITALETVNKTQELIIERLDKKEHEFNLTVTREATIMRGNIENLRSDLGRVQDQSNRIIQALDNMSSQLQDLRAKQR